MTTPRQYTTQLCAGLGAISETIELLRLWKQGMSAEDLSRTAVTSGTFARSTARRTRNLAVEMFAPRFLCDNGRPAAQIQRLLERRPAHDLVVQLFFLQAARAHAILRDFIVQVYWPKYSAAANHLTRADAESFIQHALDAGRMVKRWAPSVAVRIAQYLIGICVDFELLGIGNRVQRPFRRYFIRRETALYLAYDLHFSGLSDMSVVAHADWLLFGLEPEEVTAQMKHLAADRHLLVQSSGELTQISWTYRTMEECLHAIS